MRTESFGGILRGYGYAGLISAGPWVVSILGVLITGKLCLDAGMPPMEVQQFAVSVTYLMAGSLILTGVLQLMFTRFVADRLFEKKDEVVVPSLLGALTITTLVSFSGLLFLNHTGLATLGVLVGVGVALTMGQPADQRDFEQHQGLLVPWVALQDVVVYSYADALMDS